MAVEAASVAQALLMVKVVEMRWNVIPAGR